MSLNYTPHPYQLRAIRLLISQGGAGLFLDPGLGKTSIVLAAFKVLKGKDLVNRMLLIAPIRPMYSVWPYEIQKWADFNEITIELCHGKNRIDALQSDADIIVMNPENILWFFDEHYQRWGHVKPWFDILCIDESTKFKSYSSKRFKLLRKYLHYFTRRWILTGTPMPNGLQDLWAQCYIMDQGRALGRYISHFRREFMYQPNPWNEYGWEIRPGAEDQIVDRISPLVLQLNAEDHIAMPPIRENDIMVDLPPDARSIYNSVEDEFLAVVGDDMIVADNAAASGTKCRQIANGAVYKEDRSWVVLHDEKLSALEDLLEELNGNPLLILYEFRHDLARIRNKFPFVAVMGESPEQDNIYIQAFNAGEIPMLIGHPASMGHGINMQDSCHHVCWFGITWNYEYYDQAVRRVWRQGQKKKVTIHRIIARDTLDQRVADVLRFKERDQSRVNKAIANAARRFEHGRD